MTTTLARRFGAVTATMALAAALVGPAAAAAAADDTQDVPDRSAALSRTGGDAAQAGTAQVGPAGVGPAQVGPASTVQDDDLSEAGASPDLRFACPDGRVPDSAFTDLGATFGTAVECLVWYGITTGRTATTFDQDAPVTRAQMAVFVHRLLDNIVDLPVSDGTSRFPDVADRGFASEEINVLASDEFAERFGEVIVAGRGDGSFGPAVDVDRAQMGSFIARAFRAIAADADAEVEFVCDGVLSDEAAIPAVHLDNVKLLCGFDITQGRQDGSYGPTLDVSRGQMAAFLTRTQDVFARAEITLAPDRNLFVDQRTCAPGAAGTATTPLCTIGQAASMAEAVADDLVLIRVRGDGDGSTTYVQDVAIDAASSGAVVLASQADGASVRIDGSVELGGADGSLAVLLGFDVVDDATALTIVGDGDAAVFDSAVTGATAVLVDQAGLTVLDGVALTATARTLDVVDSAFVDVFGTDFVSDGAEAFVVLPDGVPDEFLDDLTEPAADNTFDPGPPLAGRVDGRAALIPPPP